ncbi:hypothetical protein [Dethiobacter alkaliphilus]|uniref:hypothetical protein n=1 Tax=Dethiobacter alkaliphilus TaxID=427926 RepID=UPI0022274D6E|nr:hypothetical protein [Dethiobacter alkaliphilus]MCW3488692.1 hypothetical protein [Dethiobacter alkaliphilus]
MSGEKCSYISVPDRELRRLRERDSRLRNLESDLPGRLEDIRRQAKREMESHLAPIENRIRQQERAARDMRGQIDAILAEARQKKETARRFFVDLSKLVEDTGNLPHGRFAPGKLEAVSRHVEDARRNYENNMPEASLSTAQQAYWDIADLREEVLSKQKEFIRIRQAALQEARILLETARANQKYQLEMGQGADSEVLALEVDYWTRGELSSFEAKVKALEKQLEKGKDTFTIEQVKEILSKITVMKPGLNEIVDRARENILASQLRVNMAEMVVDALQGQGFVLEDSAYEGGDERNAFVAKVKNVAGSEVVTVISPVKDEAGKNAVSIHSYDETFVDEDTLLERAEEVSSILSEGGLEAEAPVCAGKANPQYRDIAAVRKGEALKDADRQSRG